MIKKIIAVFIAIVIVFGTIPIDVFANNSQEPAKFEDMPENWSRAALENAVENGLLSGVDGKIMPNEKLTRAQMATVITRAFGAKDKGNISKFSDVKASDWFYDSMSKAYKMGVIKGSNNKLNPKEPITRQEAFVMIARAFKLEPADVLNKSFEDTDQISDWAKEEVYSVINNEYIQGSNGKINPKGNITRAEFAQVFYNIVKEYIQTEGTYKNLAKGNIMVSVPNVILKDLTIEGDLIIGDGVGEGDVILDSVKVRGRIVVRGGGENSIIIKGNSDISNIIVAKVDGVVSIKVQGDANVEIIYIDDESDDVNIEGQIGNLQLMASGIIVGAIDSQIKTIDIIGKNSKVIIDKDSKVENININKEAVGIKLEVVGIADKVTTQAPNTQITGKGKVSKVEVKEGGNNAKIETTNTKIQVDKGVTGVTLPPTPPSPSSSSGGGSSSGGSSSGGTTVVSVGSININKSTTTLVEGTTETLTVTFTPSNASNKTITWTTSDASKATIDSTGKVRAVSAGTATITAKSNNGKTATCVVTVTTTVVPVSAISISGDAVVGKELTANPTPSGATGAYQWYRCDTNAESDAGTPITDATAKTYKLTDYDLNKYIKVKVTGTGSYTGTKESTAVGPVGAAVTPSVTSVAVSPKTASVEQGATEQLTATVVVEGGAAQTVTWSSSDTNNKVTVSETGLVTVAADATTGEYTITATSTVDNTKSDTATITVTEKAPTPSVTSVAVSPKTASVEQGATEQLTATVVVEGGAAQTVTWSSSDTNNKVTVDNTGLVTVAADATAGDYTITATSTVDNTKSDTVTITVTEKAVTPSITSVAVTPKTASVEQGETQQLTATVVVEGGAVQTVTWSSSDSSNKVKVDSTGKVIVDLDADIGEYTITATSTADNTKSDTATITVTEKAVKVTSVTLNKYELNLSVGGEETLVATVKPEDATNKNVTWESDKTNIATVDDKGKVTAVAAGNAVITVVTEDDPEVKNTCNVTVSEATGKIATFTVTGDASIVVKDKDDTEVTPSDNKYTLPEGKVTVTVTPSEGKQLKDFTVDGDKTGVEEVTVGSVYTFDMPANDVTVEVTVGEPDKKVKIGGAYNNDPITLKNGSITVDSAGDPIDEGTLTWSYFTEELTMNDYEGEHIQGESGSVPITIRVVGKENKITAETEALLFNNPNIVGTDKDNDKLSIVVSEFASMAIFKNVSIKNATLEIEANLKNASNTIRGVDGFATVDGGDLIVRVNKISTNNTQAWGISDTLTLKNGGTANIEVIGAEGTTRITAHNGAPWISSASKVVAAYTAGDGADADNPLSMTVTVPASVTTIKSTTDTLGEGVSSILVGDSGEVTLYAADESGNKGEKLAEPIELAGGSTIFYAETSDGVWFKITVIRDAATQSNDASISTIKVNGVEATAGSDNNYNVELEAETVLADLTKDNIVVEANHNKATVGEATTNDSGKTWSVEVTAEDGTIVNYTINVTVAESTDIKVTFAMGTGSDLSNFDDVLGADAIASPVIVELDEVYRAPALSAVNVGEGYTFDGWFTDTECTTAYVPATDAIKESITLYAKFSTIAEGVKVTTFDKVFYDDDEISASVGTGKNAKWYNGVLELVPGQFDIYISESKIKTAFGEEFSGTLKIKLNGDFIKDAEDSIELEKINYKNTGIYVYVLASVSQNKNHHTFINPSTLGQWDEELDAPHLAEIHLIP